MVLDCPSYRSAKLESRICSVDDDVVVEQPAKPIERMILCGVLAPGVDGVIVVLGTIVARQAPLL